MENPRFENIDNKDGFYIEAELDDATPQTAANYGIFFICIRPCEILEIAEVHGTASSSGTVQVERLTGTTAKGSGDNVLVTAFSTASAANTVQFASTTALQNRQLRRGDRLALKSSGTLTSLKDLELSIYCKPSGKGDYR